MTWPVMMRKPLPQNHKQIITKITNANNETMNETKKRNATSHPEARTDARDRTREQTKDDARARGHKSTFHRRKDKSKERQNHTSHKVRGGTSGAPHTSATPKLLTGSLRQ